ncbi:hypothetical protein TrST_g13903 [Triparma strigata]|uniref:Uncharacterized protein n=1 Tax=Triparma strigata TaxID=1606541 RepID=A0A9W7BES7_9STRA|nr:hypothetical protein TrST_g13903 [Triparma strigata]
MSATAWIPNFDSTIYFDPTAPLPDNFRVEQPQEETVVREQGGSGMGNGSRARDRATAKKSEVSREKKIAPKSPDNFNLHFSRQTISSKQKSPPEGSSSYKGTAFGAAPPVHKPHVDLGSSLRPWEPSQQLDDYLTKSTNLPTRQDNSPKKDFSFGSSTPRNSVLGLASSRGVYHNQTADHYAARTPNADGPSIIQHNRHRSNTHHDSRFLLTNKNSGPAGTETSGEFYNSQAFVNNSFVSQQNHNSDFFVADFGALVKSRAKIQQEKEKIEKEQERREAMGMSPARGPSPWDYETSAVDTTPRWHAVARSLWLAIVVETGQVHLESLRNYIDVLQWRAEGQIDEAECAMLTEVYVKKSKGGGGKRRGGDEEEGFSLSPTSKRRGSPSNRSGSPSRGGFSPRKSKVVTLKSTREMFYSIGLSENDLDIFLAIIINEHNKRLLAQSISGSWIAMCEALFFSLDKQGHGVMGVEEAAFLARCIVLNRLRGAEDLDEEGPSASTVVEEVSLRLWNEMQMNSEATTARGQVKGTVTLASFKAFCLRSALGENEMALVAKLVNDEKDFWSNCWKESIDEVQDNFGGFGKGIGPSPDLAVFLEVDAANRVGGMRFGNLIRADQGNDVDMREALSSLASSLVATFARTSSLSKQASADATYRAVYKCLQMYIARLRAWNSEVFNKEQSLSETKLKGGRAKGNGGEAFRDVSVFFPDIIDLLPKTRKAGAVSWEEAGNKSEARKEEGSANSPWLNKLREKHKEKLDEAQRGRAAALAGGADAKEAGGEDEGEGGRKPGLFGSTIATPIDPKNGSRHNLTINTGDFNERGETPRGGDMQMKPESAELPTMQQNMQRQSSAPLKPTITFCGDVASEAMSNMEKSQKLYSDVMSTEWEEVYVNSTKPAGVVDNAFDFHNAHTFDDAKDEGERLEELVDALLRTNDLGILDQLRAARGMEGEAVPPPAPAAAPSPRSVMRKKGQRGNELAQALRNLTPTGKGKGKKTPRRTAGTSSALEAVVKLGFEMNAEDGGDNINQSPMLRGIRSDQDVEPL